MKKKIAVIVLGLFLVGALAGCGNKVPADAVATVNGEAIVQADLDVAYEQYVQMYSYYGLDISDPATQAMIKQTALDQLISQNLLLQEADKRNLEVTEEEIQEEIEFYITSYYETEEKLLEQLESYGMTMDDLRSDITDSLLYDKLVQDLIDNMEVEVMKARHILLNLDQDADEETTAAVREEAMGLIAQLDNGADFATLAQENSDDTSSAVNGGDIGYFVAPMMVTPFSEAAAALEIGQYTTEPVQSDFGYHIILLEDKQSDVKLSDNTDGKYDSIISYENNYAIYDLEDELRAEADIEYLVDFQAEAQAAQEQEPATEPTEEPTEEPADTETPTDQQ